MLRHKITVPEEEWTPEDDANMRQLAGYRTYPSLRKLINKRLKQRINQLIDGKSTRPEIQELTDLLLEIDHYADPS